MVFPIISLASLCAAALRRRSFRGRSRGSAPSVLPLSRLALTRRCACRRARDRRSSTVSTVPPSLLLGPHSRFVGHEGIALHRVCRHHDVVIQSLEKQLVPVARPHRVRAAAVRDLPFAALVRKGSHINLVGPRLVGRIGHPPPVGRKRGGRSSAGVCRKTSGFPARSPAPSLSSGTVHRSICGFRILIP